MAGPGPATPGTWRSTGSSPTPTSLGRSSATTPSNVWPPACSSTASSMPIRVRWNADDRQVGRHLGRAPIPGRHPRRAQDGRLRLRRRRPEPLGDPPGADRREPPPRGPQADRAGPSLPPAHGPPRLDRQGTLRRTAGQPGGGEQVALLLTLPVDLQEQVDEGSIPATAAYEVAKVEDDAVAAARSPGGSSTRTSPATPPPRSSARPAASRRRRPARPAKSQGRGDQPTRGSVRVFKAGRSKVALTFPRKSVRDDEVIAALEDALENRPARRAFDRLSGPFPGKLTSTGKRRRPPREGWPFPIRSKNCAGRNRTTYLQVMSLASYRCSTAQEECTTRSVGE